jgi:hypothetical protein
MQDIFESLKSFIVTEDHLKLHTELLPADSPWNKGLTGYKNLPCSEETKRKISEAKKGMPTWNKGLTSTVESKQKNSKSHLGKTHTLETRYKISNSQLGKKRGPYKKKIKA